MKKVATAVALCSVAAAARSGAASVASGYSSKLQKGMFEIRGGDSSINSTSIPDTSKSKRKKRTKKTADKTTGATHRSHTSHDEQPTKSVKPETSPETSEQQPEQPKQQETQPQPDPFLEDLIRQQDYYAILGVSKTANDSQIKKAYRKRAVQTHPDKTGGDRRAFDRVSEAYTILSDEAKRTIYDRYGKKGLDQPTGGFPAGRGPEDLFRHFFGQDPRVPRNRTVRYQLEVSLEDLYQGMTRSILVEQPVGRKKVQVHIPRGTASGETITLSGEMDDYADATPGDLIFVLQQRPHARFARRGHDLAIELTISLQEAIGGVEREITHLDGRKLILKSARRIQDTACWIQTGDVHVLKGEGMPKPDSIAEFGDLYVQFRVEVPKATSADRLTVEERKQLGHLLDKLEGKKPTQLPEGIAVKVLEKAKLSDFGTASGPFRRQQDEHAQDDDQNGSRRSFYWSTAGGFGGTHPFFGGTPMGDNNDDGSNVQCQQM